jgi:uncharacterized protein (TIGR03086 family)
MDHLVAIDYSLGELRRAVGSLDESVMARDTNCPPWTVRRLASHALNNQLFWGGLVTGQSLVAFEDVMGAVPIEGDLGPTADEATARASSLWRTDGVLDAVHATPLGEVPGQVVVQFAIIDALAHAWDLSSSVGGSIEFDEAHIPWISEVVATTCTDAAREHGLIKAAVDVPAAATATDRLMAAAGRAAHT